ncbi:MAG: hypothetical protein ISR64_01715 [Deltaproteobacteria bacterium]|nr:hypothetical protein [Deltaproteobacteria bacterium]
MAMILAATLAVAVIAPSTASARSAWSMGFGVLFGVKSDIPDCRYAGALTAQSEYQIEGPIWFAMGARFASNHRYFGWAIQPGFLVKVEAGHGLEPTFRAHILLGSQHQYSDFTSFNYFLGGVFGPGLRFRLDNLALFVDLGFEVAGELPGYRTVYFGLLPVFGLEF